ncbi:MULTISPECIES: hypothetical protein [unclassified Microcoleus]|uniref:hypothetical protein n=1 Tax=unclassified Microcoleus TaxID=2642155 RepID=UPI002FD28C20
MNRHWRATMLMKLAVTVCGPPFKQVKAKVRRARSYSEQESASGQGNSALSRRI